MLSEGTKEILDLVFNSKHTTPMKGLKKRRIKINGVSYNFTEQNTEKNSSFALRARNGERIAWGFDENGDYAIRVSELEGVVWL